MARYSGKNAGSLTYVIVFPLKFVIDIFRNILIIWQNHLSVVVCISEYNISMEDCLQDMYPDTPLRKREQQL